MAVAIGCDGVLSGAGVYSAVGCAGSGFTFRGEASGGNVSALGAIFGWNRIKSQSGNAVVNLRSETGPRGAAIVGNIIESYGTATNAALVISADGNKMPQKNVVTQGNTIVGQRANLLYLDSTANVEKSGYFTGNSFDRINIKSDLFADRSENIGNWSARYRVGWAYNAVRFGGSDTALYGPNQWLGELPGIGEAPPVEPDWADDRSHTGTNAGGGDYTPGSATEIITLPGELVPYLCDLNGATIAIDGTALAGAVQPQ